jgi:hypothetical protein
MGELIGHIILRLDHLCQKPLRRAVPDLDQLLANPADYLSCQEVTLRPWRRWGSGIVYGLILWLGLMAVSGILLGLVPGANQAGRALQVRRAVLVLVLPPACLLLGMYWGVRGGSCILSAVGVRLIHGGTEVFCPWSLFPAPGQPVIHPLPGRNRLELPVAAAAVPLVEARRHGLAIAQGMAVRTRQFYFRSPHEAILRNLYQAKPEELAGLLLHLGRSLGSSSPAPGESPAQAHSGGNVQEDHLAEKAAVADVDLSPPATRDRDGWITVSLTRVVFPPWCCHCGTATTSTQPFRAFTPFLRLGRFSIIEGVEHVWIHVPVCTACQGDLRRRYRKTYWKTFLMVLGTGAGGGFLAGTVVALAAGDPRLFPVAPILLAFAGWFVSLFFAWFLSRWAAGRASAPVQLQRYLPEKGTVDLRFRRPEYVEQILSTG